MEIVLKGEEFLRMESNTMFVFIILLLSASSKGQALMSERELCERTKLTRHAVKIALSWLKKEKKISVARKDGNKKSVVSIVDFDRYKNAKKTGLNHKSTTNQPQEDSVINKDIDSCKDENKKLDHKSTTNQPQKAFLNDFDHKSTTNQPQEIFINNNNIDNYKDKTENFDHKSTTNQPQAELFDFKKEEKENNKEKEDKYLIKEEKNIILKNNIKKEEKIPQKEENGIKEIDPFDLLVEEWLAYRRKIKKTYKTQRGIASFRSRLKNLSGGDPTKAKAIIDQSMDNEWQGIFELKEKDYDRKRTARTNLLHNLPTTFVGSSTI